MSDEKRPVLSLRRKPARDSAAGGTNNAPVTVRRKKVVVVTAPPAWKVKKEKLEQAKRAAEVAARTPPAVARRPPEVRYLRLLPPEQAIMTLSAFWPGLSDGGAPRLLMWGIRDALFADIRARDLPLSHKQVIKCLKSLTRSECYLSLMLEGAPRYDPQGNVVANVSAEEAFHAQVRMQRERQRADRIRRRSAD
ncbi:fertility inhibition protein FinO [Klebsiella michiganensis]|uniref:fertility inhibition protein FinO n=1 Tax=Klebsiella michiganensis TaxID=1134687 RepID=UPI0032DB6D95